MSARPNHGEHGEWVKIGKGKCRCSICDFVIPIHLAKKTDMCPMCGCFTEVEICESKKQGLSGGGEER